jgi:hypothetical protein
MVCTRGQKERNNCFTALRWLASSSISNTFIAMSLSNCPGLGKLTIPSKYANKEQDGKNYLS